MLARRKFWLMGAAAAVVVALVMVAMDVWRPWRETDVTNPQAGSSATSSTQQLRTPIPSPDAPATSLVPTAPPALPDFVPTNSGCRGDLVGQKDIEHQLLGPVRIFLTLSGTGFDKVGCIAPVTASGKIIPANYIRVTNHFGFPSPATDSTGNTFVTYNPGRYDGVLVLIPTSGGFEDIGWEQESTESNPSYWGRFAIYYAELVGPGVDGQYVIRQSSNDCDPSCAAGTTTHEDLRWNGTDYVAAKLPSESEPLAPTSQNAPSATPSVSLEWACSDAQWRNMNGAEGDRLCGAPNPYG